MIARDDVPPFRTSFPAGFTLIELSIVLVIIGLIVGGVLVGRDLISAAGLRAQISQIEKFRTAVYTFKSKYGGLPGDLRSSTAAAFGMTARAGGAGHGNGDEILQGCDGFTETTRYVAGCETGLFWSDLSFANLVDGSFSANTDAVIDVPADQIPRHFPDAKIGKNNSIGVFYDEQGGGNVVGEKNQNKFFISGIGFSASEYAITPLITPMEAFTIDNKLDDGYPSLGGVGAGYSSDYVGHNYNALCRTNVSLFQYQINAATANSLVCQMYFKML